MQGLHPQQQQLAALLSVALPKDDSSPPPSEQDESSRLTALNSLHRAILYPHNALLVAHSSSFLSQGFSQLLADQSYAVRRSTAVAYGSLCSVVCSSVLASSGRQNHTVAGSVVDRFISWALPVLRDVSVGNGSAELALEALREFLDNGDPNGIEPYVLPVIKACQELLEDERTSLNLLHQLLGLLSLISLKFFRSFQPHFLDIIDLLIGWALVPDLPESDRCIIMDTFLQFQKHWLSNLQFSLDLLSKFLGDMEVLLNDTSIGTPQQFRRLLALLSCFLTVLQVTASGLLEMNMLEQMTGMLIKTVPQLLSCLSLVGKKFGWSKWVRESWRCLTLLAEILGEKFSTFYPVAFDILFQSLKEKQLNSSSTHVHGVLKSNLQLLSLQKLGLLPSSVQKMLRLCSPLSQLRLHPNYHVAGALAATYVFLLQHKNSEVIEQAMNSVMEELETLKNLLGNVSEDIDLNLDNLTITDSGCDSKLGVTNVFSVAELVALIKFDLSILLSCLCLDGNVQTVEVADMTTSYSERAAKVASYIFEKLSPFEHPIESCVNLQVHVMRTLKKLCEVEHSRKWTLTENSAEVEALGDSGKVQRKINLIIYYLRKYSGYITKGLHASSPLTVKLLALEWVQDLGRVILSWKEALNLASSFEESECDNISSSLLFSVLDAASDTELKVRSLVASILDILLQAGLIYPGHFFAVTEVVLERLGDSETSIRNAFVRVFSIVLPATLYLCGNFVDEVADCVIRIGDRPRPHWKHVFALKQLPRQLCAQQLVSILSYISQRWKVPLSSWIQRLVFSCPGTKDLVSSPIEETGNLSANGLLLDVKVDGQMLDNICSTNNIAAAWWAIHEAARYCITVRLRTNLGGPTQTFAALERMLLDVAHVLKVETELNEGNLNIGSSSAHLLPMRLLLDFVEALKKNVYNAYDGSFVLPSVTRQSSLFFRANKKVCEEWFHRICEPMMNAGLALQCHTATIHYCSLRLQDLRHIVGSALKEKSRMQLSDNLHNLRKRLAGDVLRVLRHAAMALSRNHEPEALAGLQKWVTITFSSLFEETHILLPHGGRVGSLSWITGLIYQAQGQYEKAGVHFLHLLQSEEALSCMDSDTVQFIISRIIESYTALSDWKSMETWLIELQALRAKHAGKSFSGALTTAGNEMNAIHALARFDEGDVQSAWSYLDLTPKSCNELTLDPRLALQRSEQMLLQAILLWRDGKLEKVLEETDKAKLMLQEALSVISLDGFSESAAYATQLHCIYIFEESCKIKSQDEQKKLLSMLSVLHQVVQIQINERSQNCNLWMKVFRIYKTILPTSQITLQLCQKLTTLARKQKNFSMAHRLIDYYRDNLLVCYEGRDRDLLANNLQHESILLQYAEEKHEDAMANLWSFVGQSIVYPQMVECDRENMLKAKACLKLAKWFKQEYPSKKLESVLLKVYSDFSKFVRRNAASFSSGSIYSGELIPDLNPKAIFDEIVGMAAKCSSLVCPTLCKSWLSYASWCYTEAKGSLSSQDTVLRACSLSPVLEPEVSPNRFQLTEEEVSKVETIILKLFQRSGTVTSEGHMIQSEATQNLTQETSLRSLVQQVVYLVQIAAGSPGAESSDGKPPSTKLISQLNMLLHTLAVGMEKDIITSSVNELIEIWWSLRQRRVALFGHAANGYLRFLSLSSSNPKKGDQRGTYHDILKQKTGNCILRATLYVLHILLNYGVELKDALESGLVSVPLVPWQEVTPQLFARLSSHSEVVVRKQLEGLLMMLAKLSPWSIVYPTLVGVNAYESEPPEELQRIIGCLTERYPKLVQDVQLLINELGAVTVLWEEQWLSTLQDLHSDVLRRIAMLKEEAARMAENTTLSRNEKNKINAAKYSAMMAPIIVALERRLVTTSRKPETAHEIWFQKDYGEQLKSAIAAFKIPPASLESLGEVWRPFDVIAASLANHQRKSSVALSEIAPRLALLSSSDVPVPGLETQISISDSSGGAHVDLQGFITISSFCDQVTILSTKTKPKKLVIIGSNGQKYTYLLKGREDLRLDARIMQLLQAINSCLYSFHGTHSNSVSIRNYSVTPISGRAGLIQWVDNVTSIYSIFKAWQSRAQQVQLSAMGASIARNSPMPPVPRPSDMFYGKIIPALKEKGIRKVISRGDWPHDVKRKVLLELMNETPKQLLHQEIWCASEGFSAFNSKLKRFSGSVAAMSMVGHVLGLGDRHLDNILMDFCTGDVVHIDYNVCFDKGKRLKIPEIVPFRLTQTIEAALGLTGIEGTFRANCEAVVEVLRKNKDILLMLLDVFVWDPLVEWTRDDSHDEAAIGGEERKGMELAVSLSLFASRIQEIRFPLQEHHDLLLATLPATESALEKFLIVLDQYEVVSALFFRADQERSNLLLHETSAKSIVAEATSNSEKTRTAFEIQAREFAQAKAVAIEMAQESTLWMEQHGRVIDALRNGSVPDVQPFVALGSSGEALSLTSAVVVAGVPLTIVPEPTLVQCQDIDKEVSQFIAELVSGLSCVITALQEYAVALQRVLPLNYITTSPVHGWVQALQLTVHNLSSETLTLGKRQAAELLTKFQGGLLDSIRKRHEDLSIQMERQLQKIEKVEEECSDLLKCIGSETEAKSKDRLISAFSKFMQSSGYSRKEEDGSKDLKVHGELEEKKLKVITILHTAACAFYNNVKGKILDSISSDSNGKIISKPGDDGSYPYSGITYGELEEQIEKCSLLASFVNEIQQLIGVDLSKLGIDLDQKKHPLGGNWASVFQASVLSCRLLIGQITEVALPEIIRSVVSYNSEVMDAFGSLSQIRGSIDTTLEQLIEVDLERLSLRELEQNYFVKVGFITEQQLALEEAALKGRDHLSWEEAEELATQEEACRAQLDQLHRTWNQKDAHTSSLAKREASLQNALVSAERHFSSLTNLEQSGDVHTLRSRGILATLAKPFSELESVDQLLASFCSDASYGSGRSVIVSDLVTSGYSISESIWKYPSLLSNHSFFIWKVGLVDTILDSCIHDISSSMEHNLGFEQLYNVLKKKIVILLQEHVVQYLKERVAPVFLARLEMENEHLKFFIEATQDLVSEQVKKDVGAARKVQNMLEEYCDSHETARAAKSAVSLMKRQVAELTEALQKACLEIVQLEWVHNNVLPYSQKNKAILLKYLGKENWAPTILNLERNKLLENIQSSMSSVARSLEYLQACERTSVTAEGQLERAMGWACGGPSIGGPSSTSAKNTGIPPQFHDHLVRRRQLLWAAREQSLDIMKICSSVLEFEASRDGKLWMHGEKSSAGATDDGRFWQQAYLNALTRLDATYHSFARAEQEWKLAQSSMEAAASGLLTATNELCIASAKAKSASGDMQSTLAAMQESAYEASLALSVFVRVTKEHTALTSECGPMLEEVLAITEGLHDVHNLGKEAAAVHRALMDDLSEASMILQPLEATMSTDVAALSEAITRERESKMEISPIHGQALYQSYSGMLNDACNSLRHLVPSVAHAVKELHAMLTKLARTASVHAGNLHKALEGLGESQVVRSQEVALSRSELESDSTLFGNENEIFRSHETEFHEFPGVDESTARDEEWISPPDNSYESSQESIITSRDSCVSTESLHYSQQAMVHNIRHCAEKSPSIPPSGSSIPEISYAEKSLSQLDERDSKATVSSTGSSIKENLPTLTSSTELTRMPQETIKQANSLGESEVSTSSQIKKSLDNHEDTAARDVATPVNRGKNAYALQVLRRIEMKIDGRDTSDGRQMDISEQVDHLLKQATNVDNLCNMYEGWTPWI